MYKPYLSRQKSGKSVQTTVSAGDKTTLKLVTEQLRASQKVLNKSDQFIPSVVAWCGSTAAQSAPDTGARPMRREAGRGEDQWEAGMGGCAGLGSGSPGSTLSRTRAPGLAQIPQLCQAAPRQTSHHHLPDIPRNITNSIKTFIMWSSWMISKILLLFQNPLTYIRNIIFCGFSTPLKNRRA